MAIELEQILTISAEAWAKVNEKDLTDYEAIGYHSHGEYTSEMEEEIAGIFPEEAEIVVDFRVSIGGAGSSSAGNKIKYHVSGTALIPRE